MASKKSSAELKQEATALENQIAGARKKPMNFAWLICKDGLVLETDLKKGPDVLWRNAKKNGGGPKGAQGQITVSGKMIELTCDSDEVPAQLPKLAKRFLSERGLSYKVVMKTPSGAFSDGEEDSTADSPDHADIPVGAEAAHEPEPVPAAETVGDAPEAGTAPKAAEDAPGEDALRESLLKEFRAMSDTLEKAKRCRNMGAAKKVAALDNLFRTQIDVDVRKTRAALSLLAKTVEDAIAFGVKQDRATRLKLLAGLETEVDALLAEFA